MTSESNFVQPAIPRFDGHYDHWSMLMENFLRSKEYWTVVISGVEKSKEDAALTEEQLKDLKAKNYLFQAIDRSILETILCKNTAKDIWDSMKKKYQGTTRAKRQQLQALRSEFEMLRMKSGESVSEYFSRTMTIVNKMRILGDKTEDVLIIEKILRSMTPKFNFVVCAIEEANDVSTLSIDELQEVIEDEEEVEVEEEEEDTTTIKETNNKINIKRIIFKEEDVEVIIQQLIEQSQQTSPMLNVTDVIDLKTNLLSVGQLQEKGYEIAIKEGVCRIQDAKLGLIAQVNMTANHMFPLDLHTTSHSCFSAKSDDEAWLWHFRYGHLNFSGLKTLKQKNMVIGLPQITNPSQVCEECVVSKQHRNQFPQGKSWRAKAALELVHSDICGPITPHSNGDLDDDEKVQQSMEDKQQIPADLDDDEKVQQPMEDKQHEEISQNTPIADQSSMEVESQRPQRVRRRPAWMSNYEVTGIDQGDDPLIHFALFSDCDPTTFESAVKDAKWRKAMDDEIEAIERNNTWELTDLPKGHKTIGVKWVFKTKIKENGEVDKYKARLVAKGYKQEYGIDYTEVFAPVASNDGTIRLVYCRSEDQVADIQTKPLKLATFEVT
ncbi:uncharacterized protein LOC141837341 [Curcuma longa]|uniref:uncharacterized protein LOC141837341 n=1 Tax=Curcuma longa TaxID=136217 RepID=UPI003D9F8C8C